MAQPIVIGGEMDAAARELGIRLHELGKAMRLIRQSRAVDRGPVSPGTIGLLLHLDERASGCHSRDLAQRTGLDPSTISRAVATLVAHGLVERQADPRDGRASVLALTDAGREVLADARSWYGEVLHRALADWTPGEVAALSTALGRFTDDVEKTLCRHSPHDPTTLEAAR